MAVKGIVDQRIVIGVTIPVEVCVNYPNLKRLYEVAKQNGLTRLMEAVANACERLDKAKGQRL